MRLVSVLLTALLVVGGGAPPGDRRATPDELALLGWTWPLDEFRLARPYVQPVHAYAPGHRGIDLRTLGDDEVRSPAPGVVAFVGRVVDRPLVTIDHGNGLVTTLEPVASTLRPGELVAQGEPVGSITSGGHTTPGELHFGVRLHGEYLNPLLLLGGIPRAVLLPCC